VIGDGDVSGKIGLIGVDIKCRWKKTNSFRGLCTIGMNE
jgi:hypothetical protein